MNNEIKINVPEGMEIDKENSTFECIKFKPKWIPKRGDIAAAGSPNSLQIILVGEYIKSCNIVGFDVTGLAVLSVGGHLIIRGLNGEPLWVEREASASEKELLINKLKEEGYIYDLNDPRIIYKKEKELPKTWKEFCENNPITHDEYYIDGLSDTQKANSNINPRDRNCFEDANSFPSKDYAEAMLALCKLIQLRDCYNDGWKANWDSDDSKYIINIYYNEICRTISYHCSYVLAFKTPELRKAFLENFRDLIEQAKLLL